MKSNEKSIMVSGKRKTSIAKAKIVSPGSGKVIIDRIPYEKLDLMKHLLIDEPIRIAKKIVKYSNSKSKIINAPDRLGQDSGLCCDNSKAKRLFNWEPKISIEEGLKKNIEWIKNLNKNV